MKAYVAARFDKKQEVLGIHQLLRDRGYEIAGDWTTHKAIKPYEENQALAREYTTEDINGVAECDLFIILSSDAGTGMYTELGAAILSNIKFGKPLIFVVGEHTARAMFYFHPSVKRRSSIEEVLKEIDEHR